jgi:transposase
MTRKAYPCDVTDREWQIIEPLLPEAQGIGRPRQVDLREIVNGIFYVLREGCSWRALPHDLYQFSKCRLQIKPPIYGFVPQLRQ